MARKGKGKRNGSQQTGAAAEIAGKATATAEVPALAESVSAPAAAPDAMSEGSATPPSEPSPRRPGTPPGMPTRRLNRSIEEKRVQTIEEKRSPAVLQDGEKIKMQMVRVMRGYIVVNH
jgi:hypothetical protein